MRDSWDNMFEEVPASFEARMKETLSALEEKPKIRHFRFGTGALVAAVLLHRAYLRCQSPSRTCAAADYTCG